MVLESRFIVHHQDYILEDAYSLKSNDTRIEREIIYDSTDNSFIDLERYDDTYIDNIYTEILPIHVELVRLKQEDMVIKDRRGRLTLLTVMPF